MARLIQGMASIRLSFAHHAQAQVRVCLGQFRIEPNCLEVSGAGLGKAL